MASLVVVAEPLLLTIFASLSIPLHCKSTATAVASLTSSRISQCCIHRTSTEHPHTGCKALLSWILQPASPQAMANRRTLRHQDYSVGWICASSLETEMATGMLDELHGPLPRASDDQNIYTLGRIGAHNVVIACPTPHAPGLTSAGIVMASMLTDICASIWLDGWDRQWSTKLRERYPIG
jgi:hypothetical protein